MSFTDIGPVVLVGAGKMGLAMARSWMAAGLPPSSLVLVDPQPGEATTAFARENDIRLLDSPVGILVHVLVLAVKPQLVRQVLDEIAPAVGPHTLVVSIAAGIPLAILDERLDTSRLVRAMPNTPAQIGKGITGAVGRGITDADRAAAQTLLAAMGEVLWLDDETDIDGVTAVSGSGPAYVFYMVEALATAARNQGFDAEQAMQLARQTVIGAAALLQADPAPAAQLREDVTSPNGTTAAALSVLMGPDGLERLMDRTVAAARRRSEELGRG